ncbi:MAG TPA: ATP-binding protein [Longimicrobiales bacterium]|nr:ATP-binding protein [Longimicrobiales bacterium]
MRRGAPLRVNDYAVAHGIRRGLPRGHLPLRTLLVVPMLSGGRVTAMAAVASREGGYTQEDELQVTSFLHTLQTVMDARRAVAEETRLQAELEQARKLESVGRLAGGVAHDFNNMLGVILGHTEMAVDLLEPGHPALGDLLQVQRAAERSAELTRQLLAFARKQTVAPRLLDLNEEIESSLQILRRMIGEDVQLRWIPGQGVDPVRMDPTQLSQILANLCANARDAMEGPGTVILQTRADALEPEDRAGRPGLAPGRYVVPSVADDGKGMDPETLAHAFEPFFTTKELGKGTGLGLATAYGAVKQNGGAVEVASEPGSGTRFTIWLPEAAGGPERAAVDGEAHPPSGGTGTVLVVEGEPAILHRTAGMLRRVGYTVLEAPTPGEGLRLAGSAEGPVHLLLTDVVMPGVNGKELADGVRGVQPGIALLFMSGYPANVIVRHGILDEGVRFVQKPFTLAELARAVRAALDRR